MVVEIVFGVVLAVVAFFALLGSFEEPWALVLFVPAGVAAGLLFTEAISRDVAHERAKHAAIYRDVVRQGFHVRERDVYASGNLTFGSEVDVRAGRCLFPLIARKVDGRWRLALPESGADSVGGVILLDAAAVRRLAAVCPR